MKRRNLFVKSFLELEVKTESTVLVFLFTPLSINSPTYPAFAPLRGDSGFFHPFP